MFSRPGVGTWLWNDGTAEVGRISLEEGRGVGDGARWSAKEAVRLRDRRATPTLAGRRSDEEEQQQEAQAAC